MGSMNKVMVMILFAMVRLGRRQWSRRTFHYEVNGGDVRVCWSHAIVSASANLLICISGLVAFSG
jgi:hypothetical protein